ncbi:hypothetical protein [Rhodococcoides fascians]|uniref:hypothetical protein n=1 Tax=Rhodococcoides fascians TaxID=1828 RepID=UPI0024BA28E2|nr:hypothetical protein [Rhodococcus fascians]MDJ0470979.1 hypothetical protein [Rhodococcus fascians]
MTQQEISAALEQASCIEEVHILIQQQAILSLKNMFPEFSDKFDELGSAQQ